MPNLSHYLFSLGFVRCVAALLEAGADPALAGGPSGEEQTPLHMAVLSPTVWLCLISGDVG
jgi:hypothetical protein